MNNIINCKSKYQEKNEGNERIYLYTQKPTNINSFCIIGKDKKDEMSASI